MYVLWKLVHSIMLFINLLENCTSPKKKKKREDKSWFHVKRWQNHQAPFLDPSIALDTDLWKTAPSPGLCATTGPLLRLLFPLVSSIGPPTCLWNISLPYQSAPGSSSLLPSWERSQLFALPSTHGQVTHELRPGPLLTWALDLSIQASGSHLHQLSPKALLSHRVHNNRAVSEGSCLSLKPLLLVRTKLRSPLPPCHMPSPSLEPRCFTPGLSQWLPCFSCPPYRPSSPST